MHLGRFNATVFDLAQHFENANLPAKLEECASTLDQYAHSRDQSSLDLFRNQFHSLLHAADPDDPDLDQPYARQIIDELGLDYLLAPALPAELNKIMQDRAFDHAGIASDFRSLAKSISTKSSLITAIDQAFTDLHVEFERVSETEAEVGILIPREVIGESLTALTSEFAKLGKLSRAINELTGAPNYEPTVRTISSSWWQVFLNLESAQILVWVFAIERIVALFQSNLEIKELQRRLSDNQMPQEINDLIENEINRRVTSSIDILASELRNTHANVEDQGRLNEIEIQLRQGLRHLAMRINQGTQIEINVGVPDTPEEPTANGEGENVDPALLERYRTQKALIIELSDLRNRGRLASSETLKLDGEARVLLKYFSEAGDPPAE